MGSGGADLEQWSEHLRGSLGFRFLLLAEFLREHLLFLFDFE